MAQFMKMTQANSGESKQESRNYEQELGDYE